MSDELPSPNPAPVIKFPEALPVSRKIREICDVWSKHQVIVLGGDTGSGKTTQLPKAALVIGCKHVGITQPRRIAAVAMARRVAEECGTECGGAVGYQVRFDSRVSPDTCIKFMTDGILLAETRHDRMLKKYDAIIIDEAHERSLNIDFLLGYLKNLLPRRPDLKVAISSATMDLEHFSEFFGHAPAVEVEGRMFPVEDHFQEPLDSDEDLPEQVARAVDFLNGLDSGGDILAFLPGEREIRECADMLEGRKYPRTEVLPLFARLSGADQQKVFRPGHLRRIILATNVAETSITIPRIKFCIDSGLARISRYNPRTRIQELRIEQISKASVRQRRGRCGRTADGICVHLYGEDVLQAAPDYTDPEIKRTSLAGVILQMAVLNLPEIGVFPFPDPPQSALIREGLRHLEDLGAMLPGGRLTQEGRLLAELPIDPHLGKMLLEAARRKVLADTLPIAAYLSIPDPSERPFDKQQQADGAHRKFRDETSDYMGILKLWRAFRQQAVSNSAMRKFAKQEFMNFARLREWRNLEADLRETVQTAGMTPEKNPSGEVDSVSVHKSILAGIPRQIARYVPDYKFYLGPGGKKYVLFPGSGLSGRKKPAPWIMSFALVETARLFGRKNAEIEPEWLYEVAPHLCRAVYEGAAWDAASGFVYAREKLLSGNLMLHSGKKVHYGAVRPEEAREIFIREALAAGALPENLPGWAGRQMRLVAELRHLEVKLRRPGGVYDPEKAVTHFLRCLPDGVLSTPSLLRSLRRDRLDLAMTRENASREPDHPYREEDYPDFLTFAGRKFALEYIFSPGEAEDGVRLLCPKDEVNLLPEWVLDWPVPGFLEEKVLLLLKQLPKEYRRELAPLGERAEEFAVACACKDVFTEQPLWDALKDFLGNSFPARPPGELRFPPYMKLRLAVLGKNGEMLSEHDTVPRSSGAHSQVSAAVCTPQFRPRSGLANWPDDLILQDVVTLDGGRTACPALTAEPDGSVSAKLFLVKAEAQMRHREGLVRLFTLLHGEQVKFLKNSLHLSSELLLGFFVRDPEKRYRQDFVSAAILRSFGLAPETVRDSSSWRRAEKNARENAGSAAAELGQMLTKLYDLYAPVRKLAMHLKNRRGADSRDLCAHLDSLFEPGFLARPAVWSDYSRYLRAARFRAERLDGNPAKDAEKTALIAPWQEKFDLALESAGSLESAPALADFRQILEECRIAVFAPEIPLKIRNPLKEIVRAWETLRF